MSLEECNTKAQRHEGTKSEDEISHQIIGAAIEVHRTLGGPGLLESIYESALCHELILRGLRVQRQKPVQFVCKERFTNNKRHLIDFLVSLSLRVFVLNSLDYF